MKTIMIKTAVCTSMLLFVSISSTGAQVPDNAALLYYQAFLLYEKPDETTSKMLDEFRSGKIKANKEIEQHIEKNRRVIDSIVTATNISNCDWGYNYTQGLDLMMPNLAQLRRATFLIQAESKLLCEQGDYRTALDRCLSMHKMALHTADATFIGYLVAISIGQLSNDTIQDILADMPEDLQALERFRNQLARLDNRSSLLRNILEIENEVLGKYITKEYFNELLSNKGMAADPQILKVAKERFLDADEQFYVRNRNYWQNYFAAVQAAIKLPYAQAFAELKRIEEKTQKDALENIDATSTAILAAPQAKIYTQDIYASNVFNAIRAAIEIYIIKAKTKQLPDELPEGLPKDLFSDKDFEYEKTRDGFILRCRGKDLFKNKIREYEFKVK
jgi:hypothetical protein